MICLISNTTPKMCRGFGSVESILTHLKKSDSMAPLTRCVAGSRHRNRRTEEATDDDEEDDENEGFPVEELIFLVSSSKLDESDDDQAVQSIKQLISISNVFHSDSTKSSRMQAINKNQNKNNNS